MPTGRPIGPAATGLPLRQETAVFNDNRAGWIALGHLGEWVSIKGDAILSFFPDIGAAYSAGVNTFGSGPFLVKQVTERDHVAITHRVRQQRKRA